MTEPKNAWITLDNHIAMDGQEDTVGIETLGAIAEESATGSYLLQYFEADENGADTAVGILAGEDRVVVSRKGPVSSLMRLTLGKRESCTFEMPEGSMTVDVELLDYTQSHDGETHRWKLHYHMYFGPGQPADHHMVITAKEK